MHVDFGLQRDVRGVARAVEDVSPRLPVVGEGVEMISGDSDRRRVGRRVEPGELRIDVAKLADGLVGGRLR